MARRGELSEEPPDATWLDEHANARHEQWEGERTQRRIAARARRRAKPLHTRVFDLGVELHLSSSVPAARISGGGGHKKPDSEIPPAAEQSFSGEHPRELKRLWRLLEEVVGRLEALADNDPQEPLTGSDLDRRLFDEFVGYTPEEACLLEPLFGSPEAIRRARRNAGLKAGDGT